MVTDLIQEFEEMGRVGKSFDLKRKHVFPFDIFPPFGKAELLIVDEAAAIPLPIVKKLLG